jgi:cellulose synthase/poly-beta-1,6-N-acetylglucosamine synthase-like glycosyltransferase
MDNQLRFCLVVSGRNNTQNNRHYKNLKTIFAQDYSNLYVVYIDDVSDDATMAEAMAFTRQQKFPKEKIVFVQNINRKFASYNTVNAAFNFCDEDDIQVKFDADDELVGRHAISVLNAVYQQHP